MTFNMLITWTSSLEFMNVELWYQNAFAVFSKGDGIVMLWKLSQTKNLLTLVGRNSILSARIMLLSCAHTSDIGSQVQSLTFIPWFVLCLENFWSLTVDTDYSSTSLGSSNLKYSGWTFDYFSHCYGLSKKWHCSLRSAVAETLQFSKERVPRPWWTTKAASPGQRAGW